MTRFHVTKSLKDYRITLYRVSMAAKWTLDLEQEWDNRGSAECEELRRALEKGQGARNHETCLEILKGSSDKLVKLAKVVQTEAEDRSGEELSKLNAEVLLNKSCLQSMAQMH